MGAMTRLFLALLALLAPLAPRSALALALATAACGSGSDSASPDAGPDAEDLCPGQVTFEAEARLLASSMTLVGIAVADGDDPGSAASSAPNGRVVLCLDDAVGQVVASHNQRLERRDTLEASVLEDLRMASQPYPLEMASAEQLDLAYADFEITRSEQATQLVVAVATLPGGEPTADVVVQVEEPSGKSLNYDLSGGFLDSDQTGAGGGVLVSNVMGETATVTVEPTFDAACVGPSSVALQPGGVAGAVWTCR